MASREKLNRMGRTIRMDPAPVVVPIAASESSPAIRDVEHDPASAHRVQPPSPDVDTLIANEEEPISINIYDAENDLADLRTWRAQNPTNDQQEEAERDAEENALEASISAVRAELLQAGATGVLQQARLTQQQVERKIAEAIQRRGGASREEMDKNNPTLVRTKRFLKRAISGALGTSLGGMTFAVLDALPFFTANPASASPFFGQGLAAKLGISTTTAFSISAGFGLLVAATIGYNLTKHSMRASADARVFKKLSSSGSAENINDLLVRTAYEVQHRCHDELDVLVKKQYGNLATRTLKGMYRFCGPELVGGAASVFTAGVAKMNALGVLPNNLYTVPPLEDFVKYSAGGMKEAVYSGASAAKQAGSYIMNFIR